MMDSSLRWINAKKLKDRWKMNDFEIARILLEFDIKAYDTKEEREIAIKANNNYLDFCFDESPAYIQENYYTIADVISKLQYLMFNLSHIELFDKEQLNNDNINFQPDGKVEIKLRPSQKHKERCRAVAELIWKSTPDITIDDMSRKDEINGIACEKNDYTVDTIRRWIKDLCPNRAPGRRPKPE
jgi:hypothetical protein